MLFYYRTICFPDKKTSFQNNEVGHEIEIHVNCLSTKAIRFDGVEGSVCSLHNAFDTIEMIDMLDVF